MLMVVLSFPVSRMHFGTPCHIANRSKSLPRIWVLRFWWRRSDEPGPIQRQGNQNIRAARQSSGLEIHQGDTREIPGRGCFDYKNDSEARRMTNIKCRHCMYSIYAQGGKTLYCSNRYRRIDKSTPTPHKGIDEVDVNGECSAGQREAGIEG